MIKPARLGSSVGMSIAHDATERGPAIEDAFRHDDLAIAERYLPDARDLEVSVIGDASGALELYGPGEIVAGHEFYDYAAKYTPGLSETSLRAEVPTPLRATILKLARDAYRAIGAEGFARVDFLLAGRDARRERDQHDPGLHPDQPVPDAAGRGRPRLRRRLRAGRRPRPRAPRPALARPPHPGGPAPMSARAPVRRAGGHVARRGPTIRRASAGLSPIRAGAILVMLLTAAAIYGIAATDAFGFRRRRARRRPFHDASRRSSPPSGSSDGTNLVGLQTDGLAAALRQLPDGEGRP